MRYIVPAQYVDGMGLNPALYANQNLVCCYPLAECGGTVARDIVGGNDCTGTANGFGVWGYGRGRILSSNQIKSAANFPSSTAITTATGVTLRAAAIPNSPASFSTIVGRTHSNAHNSPFYAFNLGANYSGSGKFYAGVNNNVVSAAANYSNGTEYRVAMTYDGSVIRLFVNGILSGTLNYASGIAYGSNGFLSIGANAAGSENFNGTVADVHVYNRALTADEIFLLDSSQMLAFASVSPAPKPRYFQLPLAKIETLTASTFYAVSLSMDGALVRKNTVSSDSFTIDYGDTAPKIVTLFPIVGAVWAAGAAYAANDLVIPTNCEATPYYYKRVNAGTSGGTEPTWPTVAGNQCDDGAVSNAWECVEAIAQPVTLRPMVPDTVRP